jgi:hypothetical protein
VVVTILDPRRLLAAAHALAASPFRDEVIWVHEELGQFFKSLKGVKSPSGSSGKSKQQNNHNRAVAAKKSVEMKALYLTALKSAPLYHKERIIYLAGLLDQQLSLLKECPDLMLPKLMHLVKLLSLCRFEARWLVRHQSCIPQRKQDQAIIGGCCSNTCC